MKAWLVFAIFAIGASGAPNGMFKVTAAEMGTRKYEVGGLRFSPIEISVISGVDRPYDNVTFGVSARNHRDSLMVHGYTIYMVAYRGERKGPLFSVTLSTAAEHTDDTLLNLGDSKHTETRLILPAREVDKAAYYAVRSVLDGSRCVEEAAAPIAVDATPQPTAKKCTNTKCDNGVIRVTGFGGQLRERNCPICKGKGWLQ